MQQFLPLAYHTQPFIVRMKLFDRQAYCMRCPFLAMFIQATTLRPRRDYQRSSGWAICTRWEAGSRSHCGQATGSVISGSGLRIQILSATWCWPTSGVIYGRDPLVSASAARRVLRFDDLAFLFKTSGINIGAIPRSVSTIWQTASELVGPRAFQTFSRSSSHMAHVTDDRNCRHG